MEEDSNKMNMELRDSKQNSERYTENGDYGLYTKMLLAEIAENYSQFDIRDAIAKDGCFRFKQVFKNRIVKNDREFALPIENCADLPVVLRMFLASSDVNRIVVSNMTKIARIEMNSTNESYDIINSSTLDISVAAVTNALQLGALLVVTKENCNIYSRPDNFYSFALLMYPIISILTSFSIMDGFSERLRSVFKYKTVEEYKPLKAACRFFTYVFCPWTINANNRFIVAILFHIEVSIIVASFTAVSFVVANQSTSTDMLFNFAGVTIILTLDNVVIRVFKQKETVLMVKTVNPNEFYYEDESNVARVVVAVAMQTWLTINGFKLAGMPHIK